MSSRTRTPKSPLERGARRAGCVRWLRPLSSALCLLSCTLSAQRGDAPDTRLRPASEQRALFRVPPGFEVQLVASEPDIQKPFNLAFDAAGRVWVTGSTLYPWPARRDAQGEVIPDFEKHWDDNSLAFRAAVSPPAPPEHGLDSVRILSDFDATTGRARKVTVFADGLNIPIGILPLPALSSSNGPALSSSNGPALSSSNGPALSSSNGPRRSAAKAGAPADEPRGDSALVFSIPAIWRLTDTNGDGRADRREKLYDGFGFRDTHGMSSSYWLWFDGWVYGTHGYSNISAIQDRSGRTTRIQSGNTYRFRPDGSRFELFVNGQTNPFGLAFDARGDLYTADSHSKPVYLLIPGGYYEGISREHDGLGFAPSITLDDHGSSAIAGIAHYSATHFPREFHGSLFNGNPVTRRVNRARLDWRGSSPAAVRQADFVTSDDPAFRPVQVKLGPDGALWIADFYNPIIGHYEVPLTHPARDRAHGRIWRVVWRGLDGSVPVPSLPDFSRENAAALVARFSDPNLVVRSLAVSELLARDDARGAAPALHAVASRLIAGADSTADGTAALPLLMTLDRLGRGDDALLRRALSRPESDVAMSALRALEARESLPAEAEEWFARIVGAKAAQASTPASSSFAGETPAHLAAPGHSWRLIAQILGRHSPPWGAPLLLGMLERAPAADFELIYALRLALKKHALTADAAVLCHWANADAATAERVADVCVAVPTPAAAEFLLGHLETTKFAGARAGEFARHAVQQLPAARLPEILPLLRSLANASVAQRATLAEGLASVVTKSKRKLPPEADTWMGRELVAAIGGKDPALALRAINAVKDLPIAEKAAPLRRVALNSGTRENNRIAALRALAPKEPETEEILIQVLASNAPHQVRRAAADLLGTANASPAARAALAAGFATASADLALMLATSLAKSDAGAADLLDLVAAGRARPALLRHRYLVLAFEKRPAALRERAAALTKSLPPEDARIDAVIAQRIGAAAGHTADLERGAALFSTHCAACHRIRDTGGNLGPNLDGSESRSLPRLVEDILDPGRNVDPAFRLHTVTLKSGETKSGMNHREQGDRVLLTEPASGQEIVVPRADIAEVVPSPLSPMPAAYETLLSEAEFFDLLAFLRTPAK